MIGKKIGHLTILERVEPPEGKENQGQTWWLCKCDCGRGRTVIKSGSALRATKNASCGCVSGRIKEKYNSYVFKENYIEVYDLNHRKFLIDIEDYESVRRFNWRVDKIGVYYCKPRNTWVAQISVNNKITYLGSSDNFEEAVKLRLYAEKKYCGEFAPQKELFDKYNIK